MAIKYTEPALMDIDGNLSSANYQDYPGTGDNVVSKKVLTVVCEVNEWKKRIVIKEYPSKKDLLNWQEIANNTETWAEDYVMLCYLFYKRYARYMKKIGKESSFWPKIKNVDKMLDEEEGKVTDKGQPQLLDFK